jgi:pimeloyl-ACP methyl ester carboxylesterase
MIAERTVLFGSHKGLVGVLSEPAESTHAIKRGVFLTNIGTHHRVGPFRLYVELARDLARAGFYVLRFDHSGMGDSEPRPGSGDDSERLGKDMSDAMDLLTEQLGVEQFVVIGLCSGVTGAHAAAATEKRVTAAAFIDGYAFPTRGYYLRHYSARFVAAQRWIRYARRKAARLRAGAVPGTEGAVEPTSTLYTRAPISLEQFRRDIERMSERGTKLLFIYTGTVNHTFNHTGQLFEMIGSGARRDGIEVDRFARADHLFSSLAERQSVIERIHDWIRKIQA